MRYRTVDVQDLFEDSRRAPVPQLPPGYSIYCRPRMAEEGVPRANAELHGLSMGKGRLRALARV